MLRFLALPAVLLAVIFFRQYPPGLAGLPLSEEQHRTQSMLSYVVGFALSIGFSVVQTVLVMLHQAFGAVVLALGLVMLGIAIWQFNATE
jgi:hypothetical protein